LRNGAERSAPFLLFGSRIRSIERRSPRKVRVSAASFLKVPSNLEHQRKRHAKSVGYRRRKSADKKLRISFLLLSARRQRHKIACTSIAPTELRTPDIANADNKLKPVITHEFAHEGWPIQVMLEHLRESLAVSNDSPIQLTFLILYVNEGDIHRVAPRKVRVTPLGNTTSSLDPAGSIEGKPMTHREQTEALLMKRVASRIPCWRIIAAVCPST
jgi:hypothetical protein